MMQEGNVPLTPKDQEKLDWIVLVAQAVENEKQKAAKAKQDHEKRFNKFHQVESEKVIVNLNSALSDENQDKESKAA